MAKKKRVKKISPKRKTKKLKEVSQDYEIAYDFATKVYTQFKDVIKSIILFGSVSKLKEVKKSDIDLIIIIDDCTVQWDQELVAWYREELSKLIQKQKYQRKLHINTVTLSTFWEELKNGEPVTINIIRYGQALIDFGGFFEPLKIMLAKGKIRPSPEAVYNSLRRSPIHIAKARFSLVSSIENIYWSMVDAAQAALMAAGNIPPSPEHIPDMLLSVFVKDKILNPKYLDWYNQVYELAQDVIKGKLKAAEGKEIDEYIKKAEEYEKAMRKITIKLIENQKIIRLEDKKELF